MRTETVDLSAVAAQARNIVASVNGVALHGDSEAPGQEVLRQRACTELLRQAAIRDGLLGMADPSSGDGIVSEAAAHAIDAWLQSTIELPEPSEEACRRHHAARSARYCSGEQVLVRHVLFAVTAGTDVVRLRNRAEACLLDVRCHDGSTSGRFGVAAGELSNCPSGANGGELGWLQAADCAPEFAREVFGHLEIGVLPRLVHSRFGLHVVEVLERRAGAPQPYEAVRGAVATALRQQAWVTAMRQTLQILAGQADVVGVDLQAVDTPLVQ